MNDEYLIYGETLTAIADSIRSVSSVSTTWTPDEMAAYILANLVKPTTRQAAKTYTPSTSNQTIPAGTFLTGAATIAGDADLTAANIKKGVNIFGKTGALSGIWGDISAFNGITKVSSGSFTVSSSYLANEKAQTITHGLGMMPKLYCVMLGDGTFTFATITSYYNAAGEIYVQLSSNTYLRFAIGRHNTDWQADDYVQFGYMHKQTNYPEFKNSSVNNFVTPTTTNFTINPKSLFNGAKFVAGVPYKWLAMA